MVSPGGLSCWHPLPDTYQNPRLPEGQQVLSINHIACANSWDTVRGLYHLGKVYISEGTNYQSRSRMPAQDQIGEEAFLRYQSQACSGNAFWLSDWTELNHEQTTKWPHSQTLQRPPVSEEFLQLRNIAIPPGSVKSTISWQRIFFCPR